MKIGYARVSTREQNPSLQIDALKQAGCERIFQDVASGAKSSRPELDKLLAEARTGDTIIIWKLDRLGRSLRHLVELVEILSAQKIGLKSLNDPVDTTHAQGRLIFNLFASLAEFKRDLIRERTNAGLSAARARGRVGGRPKGLDTQAEATAMAAETLYREGRLSVNAIADKLHISKSTLYSYLRHRGVEIGAYQKAVTNTRESQSAEQVADITLRLTIENNSQFVRGKKRARENIERYCLGKYHATRLSSGDYSLRVNYKSREDLDGLMADLLRDMSHEAEMSYCYIEAEAWEGGTKYRW